MCPYFIISSVSSLSNKKNRIVALRFKRETRVTQICLVIGTFDDCF